MTTTISQPERAFIDEVGRVFLENSLPARPESLRQWRPSGVAWPLMRRLQGRISGLRKRDTIVDGQKLVWLEGGNLNAPPVVLLHGFAASKENWLPLLPFLSRHYHLYVPDLPGWGESHFCPDRLYGLDHQSDRLLHWMAGYLKAPAHLVGSSMGGALAGFIAARGADQTRSLTLMNAAGARGSRPSPFEQDLLEGRNTLVTRRFADVMRLFTATTHRNRYLIAAALAPMMFREMVSRRDVNQHMFRELISHAPDDNRQGFTDIGAPTFILWGEQDKVLDVSCVDTFEALIPHARSKRLRGIGHLPMVEAPALTARQLRRFWGSAAGDKGLAIA